MKVSVDISPDYTDPYAVIYTNQVTDKIQHTVKVHFGKDTDKTFKVRVSGG